MYLHKIKLKDGKKESGESYPFHDPGTYNIGSDKDCEFPVLDDEWVSEQHAQLLVDHECKLSVHDISDNGVFLCGVRMPPWSTSVLYYEQWFSLCEPRRNGYIFLVTEQEKYEKKIRIYFAERGMHFSECRFEAEIINFAGKNIIQQEETKPKEPGFEKGRNHLDMDDVSATYWKLDYPINKGGMSRIYFCFQKDIQLWRAAKIPNQKMGARFEAEALRHKKMRHPNIVLCSDFTKWGVDDVLIMDFINGPSLQIYIEKLGKLEEKLAVRWTIQITDALLYIHRSGIMHRDVKPGNILIRLQNMQPFLSDFGIAREEGQATVTATGKVPASRLYESPQIYYLNTLESLSDVNEQERNAVYRRSDWYGIGLVFFMASTGQHPSEDIEYKGKKEDKDDHTLKRYQALLKEYHEKKKTWDEICQAFRKILQAKGVNIYLQEVCLRQIHFDADHRTNLKQFKERLQLYWLLEPSNPDWTEITQRMLAENDLPLDKLTSEEKKAIAEQALQNPPPFWEGKKKEMEEPKPVDQDAPESAPDTNQNQEIFWVPSSEEQKNKIIARLRVEVSWNDVILMKAQAICGAGQSLRISDAIGNPILASYNELVQAFQQNRYEDAETKLQEMLKQAGWMGWVGFQFQQYVLTRKKKDDMSKEAARLSHKAKDLESVRSALETQKADVQNRQVEVKKAKEELESLKLEVDKEKDVLENKINALNAEKETLTNQKAEMNRQQADLEKDRHALESRKEAIARQQADLTNQLAEKTKEASSLASSVQEKDRTIQTLSMQLNEKAKTRRGGAKAQSSRGGAKAQAG